LPSRTSSLREFDERRDPERTGKPASDGDGVSATTPASKEWVRRDRRGLQVTACRGRSEGNARSGDCVSVVQSVDSVAPLKT
jgi:hypothetical protein